MSAPAKQTVLIIDYAYNWAPLFKENRHAVAVEQTEWARLDASIAANGDLVCRLEAHPEPLPWTNQGRERVVTNPACVLVRNFPMGLRGESYRNQVRMSAMLPSVCCH